MRTKALLLIFGVTFLVGCKGDPNAPPIFRDSAEYAKALNDVEQLTKTSFEAMHEGFPISSREKDDLIKADKLIDGLIAFKSDSYGPYILKGLTQRALGNRDRALRAYEQGLSLAPKEMKPDDQAAIARIHDELASFYFEDKDYVKAGQESELALALLPEEASLLTNAASIQLQVGNLTKAKALITRALKSEPSYKRALDLRKLIEMGQK